MQVKATVTGTSPSMSVPCNPLDFEVTGPTVVNFAPVVPLSRDDLVAALMLAEVSPEKLAAMTVEQVRREVAYVVAGFGLTAVQDTVHVEAKARIVDAEVVAYRALCAARITEAFELAAAPTPSKPRRSRIGDVVAYPRRIAVQAA